MIRAIIFDFDGVILDSVNVKTKAFAQLYCHHGPEIERQVVDYHLAHGGISRYEKFRYYQSVLLGETVNESDVEKLGEQFSDLVFEKVLAAEYIPGARALLESTVESCLTFVATGTPQVEIDRIIPRRGLSAFFDEIHGSPKKKPQIIEDILERHSLKREEVLFIGDAMTDYNAAKETGLRFVGVRNDDTEFPQNTQLIDNLLELNEII